MVFTEEQKERMRRNRERALEIQRRKREEAAAAAAERDTKRRKMTPSGKENNNEELEDFEVSASAYVTKKEAMQTYCLPEGTLAVCTFEEKENPHRKSWTPMKLYNRAEIRRRARERFGGLEGLQAERNKRAERRFQKDLEKTKDIFKGKKSKA